MSDLADRAAESCAAVAGAGGRFDGRCRCAPAPVRTALPACSCGGRPSYRPHPALHGEPAETLACIVCGNAVGPFTNRQALGQAWRLGGWNAETILN